MSEKPSKYEAGTEGDGTTPVTRTNIDSEAPVETPAPVEEKESPKKRGRRSE